jgi:multidrug resistance efflux pump
MNIKIYDEQLELLTENVRLRDDEVKLAKAMLDACEIKAPLSGRLLRHTFYKGETVKPDMLLAEIFGGGDLLLKLRVPERYATRVVIGQKVRIQFRSSRRLLSSWIEGEVVETRDIIQTDGPQAFRVVVCKVDVSVEKIPPGATADAQIMIGRSSFWASLFGL